MFNSVYKPKTMAIIIKTSDPEGLKRLIYQTIDNGGLQTWARRGRSEQITHRVNGGQWDDLAWFTTRDIVPNNQELIFCIGFPADSELNRVRDIYGVYHGRFTERLLIQFHRNLSAAISTALPRNYETIPLAILNRLNA
jgi:hypothetical protein